MLTFYDVVIDFIFFDAFDDLENPPATLSSVMQNRWLTTGFKEMVIAVILCIICAKTYVIRSSPRR